MIAELERRINELRFIDGVEKVEHVPYQSGDQFWVRFNRPFDLGKLDEIVKKHGYIIVPFASIPSKLPRGIAELLWDGVTHVVTKRIDGWSKFASNFGFEPEGIAKLAVDLHGPYRIFMTTDEEGIQLLYEYLGVKYVPPAPPPSKPAAPVKPVTPAVAKPAQPAAPKPTAPATPPATPAQPSQVAAPQASTATSTPSQPSGQPQVRKESSAQNAA